MTPLPWHHSHAALQDLAPGLSPVTIDAPVSLWLLDHSAPVHVELLSWLSEDELSHAQCFHFPWLLQRYLAAHAVLRGLIAARVGIAPATLRFVSSANGKPTLCGDEILQFSLSYSPGRSLIGIGGRQPIGVDIEEERIIDDAEELANLYFTPIEQHMLDRARSDRDRSLSFLHGWTRKEACLKAMGTGLSYPACQLETGLSESLTTIELPWAMHAETASLTIAHHVISWARLLPPVRPVNAEQACRNG